MGGLKGKITRRQALLGASTLLLPASCASNSNLLERASNATFLHGVASGDPDQSSIVIWTRVSGITQPVNVNWMLAADSHFKNIVDQGIFRSDANRDHTVKVIIGNLKPGQHYYYKFFVGDNSSDTGRTKTLPKGHLDSLVMAVATCSNFPFGYFNAYEVIANDPNIDIIVHLGDYIYEAGDDGYGGESGRSIGRIHEPRHEIVSLSDYRQRHAQYKADACSRAMHKQHPLIAIWDDHDSTNNPWMHGAKNHQPNEGDWYARRSAALKAYFEWMPIRDPAPGVPPENYWRHYQFGDLVSLITLESRHTGRSKQIEYGNLERFKNAEDAERFYQAEVAAPDRNMLSPEMESFLQRALDASVSSGSRWRVIGNQSVIARSVMPKLNTSYFANLHKTLHTSSLNTLKRLTRSGELVLADDLDTWNGYPAARERFYDLAKSAGANDLLVISGDSHSYWANALYDKNGLSMGLELGATGISSPRSLLSLGKEALQHYDQAHAKTNKEIVWADGRHNGFIRLEINHQGAQANYITVSNVTSRAYDTRTIYTANIKNVNGALRFI